ncbi:MAG TPA: hemerythrin domain-containing protein, partial [bacterium]|nr:hemerythrin domain-containing protein [bacterium]
CRDKDIALADVCRDIEKAIQSPSQGQQPKPIHEQPAGFIVEYIQSNHHTYMRHAIPLIERHLNKVAQVHGDHHPEMVTVREAFEALSSELKLHLQKEEVILFPYVCELEDHITHHAPIRPNGFGTVLNPIHVMENEHAFAGQQMEKIRTLTADYHVPVDACTTYRLLLHELQEFEQDLHKHVHLENNVLFPKAVMMEKQIFNKTSHN